MSVPLLLYLIQIIRVQWAIPFSVMIRVLCVLMPLRIGTHLCLILKHDTVDETSLTPSLSNHQANAIQSSSYHCYQWMV